MRTHALGICRESDRAQHKNVSRYILCFGKIFRNKGIDAFLWISYHKLHGKIHGKTNDKKRLKML